MVSFAALPPPAQQLSPCPLNWYRVRSGRSAGALFFYSFCVAILLITEALILLTPQLNACY